MVGSRSGERAGTCSLNEELQTVSYRARTLVLLLALLAAVSLAACGSSRGGSSGDARKLLDETFNGSHKITSGNLDLNFTLSAQGSPALSKPVTVALKGPFASQGKAKLPKFDLAATVAAQSQNIRAAAVSTGDKGFIGFQGTTYSVPPQVFSQFKSSYEQSQAKSQNQNGNPLSRIGIKPLDWLEDPKTIGDEDVAGTSTTHITAGVNTSKFVDDLNKILANASSLGVPNTGRLPRSITPDQKGQIEKAIKNATFDVWTGKDDKTLRKLAIKLAIEVPPSANANGVKSADISLSLQIAGLNSPQTVNEPTGTKPLSDLTSQFGGGLGGLGGGGTTPGGTPGTTPTTPGASPNIKKYSDCLAKARGDLAKQQKCASLLR